VQLDPGASSKQVARHSLRVNRKELSRMKGMLKAAVAVATAFTAGTVFAAGFFSSHGQGRTYTEANYWATTPSGVASTGASVNPSAPVAVNGPIVVAPAQVVGAPGPTMAPWYPGDNINNASSALWGVGG
jgi:hypothetical protein